MNESITHTQAKFYRDIIKGKVPADLEHQPELIILDGADDDELIEVGAAIESSAARAMLADADKESVGTRNQAVQVLRPILDNPTPSAPSSASVLGRTRDPPAQRADACQLFTRLTRMIH